jgi:epoxyqueuosine reductase QueG
MGIALPDDIVDLLVQHHDACVAGRYTEVYEGTNRKLDQIAASVADRLRTAGATALAVCASRRIDQERLCGLFSHKMAAHLAGLGWIGRSCLLVTREAGPRVRWTTVLTNAWLPPTAGPVEQACGECRRCVAACPAAAFTGEPFRVEEPRDVRFDARKCESYAIKMGQYMGCRVLCGLCVAVCPHGKRRDVQCNAMHRRPLSRRL